MLLSILAFVIPPTSPGDDVLGWVLGSLKWLVDAMQQHQYAAAVGMVIMLLVWLFNHFVADKLGLDSAHMPLVSAIVGTVMAVGAALLTLQSPSMQDVLAALFKGVMLGASASGLYSLLGKYLLGWVEKLLGMNKQDAPPADPPAPTPGA